MTPTPRIAKKMMFHIVFGDNTDNNFTINKIIFLACTLAFILLIVITVYYLLSGPESYRDFEETGPKGVTGMI